MTAPPADWKSTIRGRIPALPAVRADEWRRRSAAALTAVNGWSRTAVKGWSRYAATASSAAKDWRRHGATGVGAIRSWRAPQWSTVKATSLALVHVAGVEGFRCKRFRVDLWDVDHASPEFARRLVRRAFEEHGADQLVVHNADPQTAARLQQAAAAHGATYRLQVFLRLTDLLPFD